MRGKNLIIVLVLAIICVMGWVAVATQTVSSNSNYENYVSQADTWVEQGLYQRAILKYEEALAEKTTEELYEKINIAYELRYAEAEKETYDAYYNFLGTAIVMYPGNEKLVDKYIEFCQQRESYKLMYDCLVNAKASGYDKEKADELILVAQYAFDLTGSERSGIKQCLGNYYVVSRNNEWGIYSGEDAIVADMDYTSVGLCNEEGTAVFTRDDSRLINKDGMVLGIFEDYITEAGILAEGLVPACSNGVYSYYDEFGRKNFGEYEMAGMFQNGKAAVKKDGKWMLVDEKGDVVSDKYEEIVIDFAGRYIIDGTIILSQKAGTYKICDEKLEVKETIKCDDIDIYTDDGIIAFCKEGKWGFINQDNKVVIKPKFDKAKSFSNGVAAVCKEEKWGFINKEGELVIDYQFADVGYMQENGVCPVRTDFPDEVSQNDENYLENWYLLKLYIGIVEE